MDFRSAARDSWPDPIQLILVCQMVANTLLIRWADIGAEIRLRKLQLRRRLCYGHDTLQAVFVGCHVCICYTVINMRLDAFKSTRFELVPRKAGQRFGRIEITSG